MTDQIAVLLDLIGLVVLGVAGYLWKLVHEHQDRLTRLETQFECDAQAEKDRNERVAARLRKLENGKEN